MPTHAYTWTRWRPLESRQASQLLKEANRQREEENRRWEETNPQPKEMNQQLAAWFYDLAPSIRDFHSRFISTFKRDKLKTADPADIQVIAGGNRAAHNGNCKIDAELYIRLTSLTDAQTLLPLSLCIDWTLTLFVQSVSSWDASNRSNNKPIHIRVLSLHTMSPPSLS